MVQKVLEIAIDIGTVKAQSQHVKIILTCRLYIDMLPCKIILNILYIQKHPSLTCKMDLCTGINSR